MPEVQEEDYGKKIDYDPLWKGPLEIQRVKTNVAFSISFGIFLAFWAGIAIYAYVAGNANTDHHGIGKRQISYHDYQMTRTFPSFDTDNRRRYPISYIRTFSSSDTVYSTPYNSLTLDDIFEARNIAFGFSVLAVVLSLIYITSLRWFAKHIVYTAIFLVCFILFGTACFFSYLYAVKNERVEFFIPALVSAVTFLIILILFFVLRKKINIACAVVKESSKAVMFFPSSLLFPILPALLHIITIIFTTSVSVYLVKISANESRVASHMYLFHFINIFGFIWLLFFITAFGQMTLSGTFATWYWTMQKKYIPNNTILTFMDITVRHHLGTIAVGSLILAICRTINILLGFIRRRLQGSCSPLACCLFGWYKFLFGSLERIVRYINRNAYIMCAIHGTGFFNSAKNAFNLLMRNIVKVLVLIRVTNAILLLGQFLVIGLSVLATYGWCHSQGLKDNITTAAIVVVLITSFFITISFFMSLRIAIDTVFLSALEDFERNDGTQERPHFMSFELKQLLDIDAREDLTI